MKKEREFTCPYCNCDIEYGDIDAIYYGGDIYCSQDCLMQRLDVDCFPWDDEPEFEFDVSEEDGFLINNIDDEFFSNGDYIIWDKCKLNFDFYNPDYADQVGLNRRIEEFAENAVSLLRDFKNFEFKPFEIDFSKLTDDEQVILGEWSFRIDVLGFILNYICLALGVGEFGKGFDYVPARDLPSSIKQFKVAIDEKEGRLFIERSGMKAVLQGHRSRKDC